MKKIVSISDLQSGMFVSAITKSNTSLVVKSRGMVKTQATIDSLCARGVLELEIDLSKSEYSQQNNTGDLESTPNQSLAPKISENLDSCKSFEQQQKDLAAADKLYTQARDIQRNFINKLKSGNSPDFDALHTLSQEIIDSVFDNTDALSCLVMLKESNDVLVEHSLNCAILMSIFAKYKGLSQAEVEDLTLSGLLMDCGMAVLPQELYNSNAPLSEADRTLLRTHVDIGYEIAERFSDVPPMVLDIIANHHERSNGSGYPKKRSEDEISIYAQMAAIVDSYDTLLANRKGSPSTCSQQSLELLQTDEAHNTKLVNEFILAIGLYPVGSLVHLTSGTLAIVVKRNNKYPLKPTVMTFYNIHGKHHTEVRRIELQQQDNEKILGSVRPEEFDLNLPDFFRSALFTA